jgi:two-component system, OmpR family, alkaline phosphatase synthesis response regulator PhoP
MDKKKILIVDDEAELVEMMTLRLKASGYEVVAAYDGKEILEKARAEKPDLIILDIMLPVMDGYKICADIKKDAQLKHVPVILLTAKDPALEADKLQGAHADDCMIKPFEPKELLDRIREFIKKSS